MYDLYLTSTFRHEWNRNFNPRIGKALIEAGFNCHLPVIFDKEKESAQDVFQRDIEGMGNSRIIFAIAENESPNWGGEVGFAYGSGKTIIALAQKGHDIPLILAGMIKEVLWVENLDEIENYIEDLKALIRRNLQ